MKADIARFNRIEWIEHRLKILRAEIKEWSPNPIREHIVKNKIESLTEELEELEDM